MASTTANYGWVKPVVGGDADAWGGEINTDLDGIDTTVKSVSNAIPAASSTTPAMNGTAAVGVGTTWARADHVHGTDTSRVAKAGDTMTGNLTVAPSGEAAIIVNKSASGVGAHLFGSMNGLVRWEMNLGNNGAESGGSAGSDFTLTRYDDAGNWVGVPFWIARSSGAVTFGNSLTVAGSAVVQGPVDLKVQTVTQSGASLSINRALGENCALSLTASITSVSVSNWPASGTTGKIRLIVSNTGAFSIAGWPAGTIWPAGNQPTITSGSGKKDIILLMSDDGGATIFGSVVGQDYR